MKVYKEHNICRAPSPTANPFFDLELLNKLANEGWKMVYVFNDDRFLTNHKMIKALFVKEMDEVKVVETADTEAVAVEKRGPGRPRKIQDA